MSFGGGGFIPNAECSNRERTLAQVQFREYKAEL